MLFEAGIILGAHSEAVAYPVLSGSSHVHWPYLQLERTVNVWLLCFIALFTKDVTKLVRIRIRRIRILTFKLYKWEVGM